MLQSHKRGPKEAEKWPEGPDGGISLKPSERQQDLYLFDIVASLCAGFNEHDIQFLSSLLALLRGDLSAQVEAEVGGAGSVDGRTDRNGKKCTKKGRDGRERESLM